MIIKPAYLRTQILLLSELYTPDVISETPPEILSEIRSSSLTEDETTSLAEVSVSDNLPLYSEVDSMFETMNRTTMTKDFEDLIRNVVSHTFSVLCTSYNNIFKFKRVSHIPEFKYDDNVYFELFDVCKSTEIIVNQQKMTSIAEYGINNFVYLYQILRGKTIPNDGMPAQVPVPAPAPVQEPVILKLIDWNFIKDDISILPQIKLEEGGSMVLRINISEIDDINFKLLLSLISKSFRDIILVRSQITNVNDNHVYIVFRYFTSKEERFGKNKNVNMKAVTAQIQSILFKYRQNINNWIAEVIKQTIKYQNIITDLTMKHNIISVISWCKENNITLNNHYDNRKKNKLIMNIYKPAKYFDLTSYKKCDLSLLRITNEGLYSVSKPNDAQTITTTIIEFLRKFKVKVSNSTITDATANIGGDTLSFALYFDKVNAVEIDEINFEALQSNIRAFNVKNVQLINDDYTKIHSTLKQDAIYIDAPWGGEYYEANSNLELYLGKYSLSRLVKKLKCNFIFLKVPYNYSYSELFTAFPWFDIEMKHINSFVLICLYKK